MPSNIKQPFWITLHLSAERIKSPTGLQKAWTETYFYANGVDKCVVIRLPFLNCPPWIELYYELSYNCIFSHDLYAHQGRCAPVSWSWHFCSRSDSKHCRIFCNRKTLAFSPAPFPYPFLLFLLFLPFSFFICFHSISLTSSLTCFHSFILAFSFSFPVGDTFTRSFVLSVFPHVAQSYLKGCQWCTLGALW